ncbi:MAG: dehydrogenase [Thermodesulfobacteriota bacterium]
MKQIVDISLGPSRDDYEFETRFMNQKFCIRRFGTDGDYEQASDLMLQWNKKADAIGLGGIRFPYNVGRKAGPDPKTQKLLRLGKTLETPVTTGKTLRDVGHEWSLRHTQFKFGNNYFNNARVLFFSGMSSYNIAQVMSEYTVNLGFADPLIENTLPRLINSLEEFRLYAGKVRPAMEWLPGRKLLSDVKPLRSLNEYLLRQAAQKAQIIVVPHSNFFGYLKLLGDGDLKGKTIITSTAYDDRLEFLKEKEVDVIIDTTPALIKEVVGVCVLEALLIAALNIPKENRSGDDLLDIITEMNMEPRIVYPAGQPKRVNRFAYLVHPLNQEFLKKLKPIEVLADMTPGVMGVVEKVMAYSPPFVYSKVTGIRSATGVEAEGWLIALGETPEQMTAHPPDFTKKRILQAANIAKKLGAQIMGIGMMPRELKDSSMEVAKHAALPITTGNSYVASAALWAAAEAVRRMGLAKIKKGKKILSAKTMVIGATGPVGVICSRLLARAFEEVYLVGRNIAKLLALQESIMEEAPDVKLHISTRADTYLGEMDVIVAASSGAGRVLDIMQVKPGCVITDITRPMVFSKKHVAKRPDVLVIRSGEILLPGEEVEMKDIGLPPKVAYAGLAETIILALEGRFETFTVGSAPQWDKVREIYRLGLKHGMKLAAISGVEGVISDEDIDTVKKLAVKELKKG